MATVGIGTKRVVGESEETIAEWLAFLRDAGVAGVEVGLASREDVEAFDPELLSGHLEGFDFVTVHGPFREQYDESDIPLVERVEEIRRILGAERVVYHPDRISSLSLVADRSTVAIENMQARKGFGREQFDAMMAGADVPIVIDTAHAATWDSDETRYLYETYRDRISHFHVSAYGEAEHDPFFDYPAFLDGELVSMLDGHNLVLESRLSNRAEIRREVETLRGALP